MSILLVSNSKSVFQKEQGHLIDSFDEVVRFNNYEIEGFEKYVGTKTTYWFARCCEDIKLKDKNSFNHLKLIQPKCRYTHAMKFVGEQFRVIFKDKCDVIGPAYCSTIASNVGLGDFMNEWPSVGCIALAWLIERFGQVHTYGFDYQGSSHYFKKQPVDSGFHNWAKEALFYDKFRKSGQILEI